MRRPSPPEAMPPTHFRQRGFTLAEAVVVIAVTGIVSGIVAMFIRLPMQGYVDAQARAELTDTADGALRRMARDLRLALPNSVRRSSVGNGAGQVEYLEFLITKTGARYLSEDDNPVAGALPLSFSDSTQRAFDVVGPMPQGPQAIVQGDYIVVSNLGPGITPADAYDCSVACNIAQVASAPSGNRITLTRNRFAEQPVPIASPGKHFQVVTSPVTYVCNPAARTLTRYWGYPIQAAQPANAGTSPLATAPHALLASGVSACAFSYDNVAGSLSSQRSALVGLSLTLQAPGNGEAGGAVTLFHQVHVDNTP